MPHLRVIYRAFESHISSLLQPADVEALSLTEAPLYTLIRILPALEQSQGETAAAGASASSSSGN
eukprot:2845669-Karenia_brevis.AAC.1